MTELIQSFILYCQSVETMWLEWKKEMYEGLMILEKLSKQ